MGNCLIYLSMFDINEKARDVYFEIVLSAVPLPANPENLNLNSAPFCIYELKYFSRSGFGMKKNRFAEQTAGAGAVPASHFWQHRLIHTLLVAFVGSFPQDLATQDDAFTCPCRSNKPSPIEFSHPSNDRPELGDSRPKFQRHDFGHPHLQSSRHWGDNQQCDVYRGFTAVWRIHQDWNSFPESSGLWRCPQQW
jgi:hypothetical protein